MKLELGEFDVAYTADGKATTTFEVAGYLEKKYHVMETFYQLHEKEIGETVARAVGSAVKRMSVTNTPSFDLNVTRIKTMFNNYLDSGEWERVSGQRIEAAHGRHRVHHRDGSTEMSRRSGRAFIRTGQYEQFFDAKLAP